MAQWIEGTAQSGKTSRLVAQFQEWTADFAQARDPQVASQSVLVLAMDSTQRRRLGDRLSRVTEGKFPVTAATPLSFIRQQVRLYWALIVRSLNLKAQFPITLRVENEQALALRELAIAPMVLGSDHAPGRAVRQVLDLFLMAALQGQSMATLAEALDLGLGLTHGAELLAQLDHWRNFCLQRGLLTYGIEADIFARVLLPDLFFRIRCVGNIAIYWPMMWMNFRPFWRIFADCCWRLGSRPC
ncbi:MAG: hypothetical protein HC919_11695 [Oscillatoriales cyanobacterium SM2_2_1]|nr:hypothetical protein [Oscillatoriales cyanobacterium SM2_2_1]